MYWEKKRVKQNLNTNCLWWQIRKKSFKKMLQMSYFCDLSKKWVLFENDRKWLWNIIQNTADDSKYISIKWYRNKFNISELIIFSIFNWLLILYLHQSLGWLIFFINFEQLLFVLKKFQFVIKNISKIF